jgi:hypothetical protein
MGPASLPCFVLVVLLVAAAKILAVEVGTSNDLAHLPCQPACLVGPPALSACLPYRPASLVGPPPC